jgi:hypothetical protein
LLIDVEKQIATLFCAKIEFYLEFGRKDYASCDQGQALQELTILAVNLGYEVGTLKKFGL